MNRNLKIASLSILATGFLGILIWSVLGSEDQGNGGKHAAADSARNNLDTAQDRERAGDSALSGSEAALRTATSDDTVDGVPDSNKASTGGETFKARELPDIQLDFVPAPASDEKLSLRKMRKEFEFLKEYEDEEALKAVRTALKSVENALESYKFAIGDLRREREGWIDLCNRGSATSHSFKSQAEAAAYAKANFTSSAGKPTHIIAYTATPDGVILRVAHPEDFPRLYEAHSVVANASNRIREDLERELMIGLRRR